MATYATNLSVFDAADSAGNWSEASGHTSGGAPAADTENYLQNSISVSQPTGQASGTAAGMECDYGSAPTWTSGWVFLAWQYYTAPTNLNSWANGGMRIGIGSSSGNVKLFNAVGDDFGGSPYACWQNTAIDPENTADTTEGSPTAGNYNIFVSLPNVRAKISKGNPHACDIVRYGRGDIVVTGTGADFAGMASANDAATARWGLFQKVQGGFLAKGLMSLGTSGASVTFSDSNKIINIDDTPRANASFNKCEINNTGSSVTWTGITINGVQTSITGSAPTSPWDFEMVDNAATMIHNGCTFNDLGTFIYLSNGNIDDTTYRRCGQVTLGGADMDGCLFTNTEAAIALVCGSSVSTLSNCDFISDGSSHAIEITGGTSHTLDGLTFSGYEAYSAGGTSTGNEAIYVNIPSGSVTIYADAQVSYRTAGATVNIVAGSVDVTVSAIKLDGTALNDVAVSLFAKDGTGDLPYQDSISISNSGTTATVTHTGHGMETNDKVLIEGGDQPYNRGVHQITVVNANSYTYTCDSAPTGDPTGCTATWTCIYETLSGTNTVTKSRSYSSAQPVVGWCRKSTGSPYYKPGPITGTISTTGGLELQALMLLDE